MGDLICAAQGDASQKQRVLDLTLRSLKEILPSTSRKIQDSSSLKEALAGNGDWSTTKEILGWVVENEKGTPMLSSKRKEKILFLLGNPQKSCRMAANSLERLIRKLRPMHLAVPGAIGKFYAMQVALTSARAANRATAYLSA